MLPVFPQRKQIAFSLYIDQKLWNMKLKSKFLTDSYFVYY